MRDPFEHERDPFNWGSFPYKPEDLGRCLGEFSGRVIGINNECAKLRKENEHLRKLLAALTPLEGK